MKSTNSRCPALFVRIKQIRPLYPDIEGGSALARVLNVIHSNVIQNVLRFLRLFNVDVVDVKCADSLLQLNSVTQGLTCLPVLKQMDFYKPEPQHNIGLAENEFQ